MPDLFGIYNNSKLVADDFASNGYLTIIPDIFLGDAMPPDVFSNPEFDVMKWIASNQPDKVDPVWSAAVSYLKSLPELSGKKIAAVGYCYGAKFACRALGNGTIDAAYVAHPSFVTVEELAAIKGPLSISAAETDPIFPVEKRIESEDILNGIGAIYQINLFSGVGHGFAVRADISVSTDCRVML
jgi:dienelactone hydrolase